MLRPRHNPSGSATAANVMEPPRILNQTARSSPKASDRRGQTPARGLTPWIIRERYLRNA